MRRPGNNLARRGWGGMLALAGVMLLALAAGPVQGESSQDPARASGAALEQIVIGQPATQPSAGSSGGGAGPALLNPWRLVGAMALVLLAIFAVRWAGRRFLGLPSARSSSSGAIRVLCRSVLSPRQQLMLVQVGRRMVLVGDCGSQMSCLCEITDPEEMSAITGQIQQQRRDSVSSSFMSLLGRAATPYEAPGASVQGEERSESEGRGDGEASQTALATTREELAGLLDKVRLISRSFKRA